ncbi:uncharacterized protein [Rutidosis leptorrhynchoides]|uniref:uncharacterized protein n=1 Tax=Rutidosis leptorrhynchoides TaxID=125765 RepID=UPI003A994EAA
MGFGNRWISWIASCLESAPVSILVNGSPTEEFMLRRGLGRGILYPLPLHPSHRRPKFANENALSNGLFRGVKIGMAKTVVSHLQYSDDNILFGEWNRRNILNLMKTLKCFEKISGLRVNLKKSCLFRVGVSKQTVEDLASLIGCNAGSFPMSNLGLESNQNALVSDRVRTEDSSWSTYWQWNRAPSGRTNEELLQLNNLLQSFNFANNQRDTWSWSMHNSWVYSTKVFSNILNDLMLHIHALANVTMRNSLVPQKLDIFIWRAKIGRLPVRVELDKRGIDLDSVRCPNCNNDPETVEHMLLN